MSETYASFENEKYRLEIHLDDSPRNPREDLDCHLATLVCYHRNYDLGDKKPFRTPEDFEEWYQENKEEVPIRMELFMMDHSGLLITTNWGQLKAADSMGWDWGKIGYAYTTKQKIRQIYGVKAVTKKVLERAAKHMLAEIEEYSEYVAGHVYGFKLFRKEKCAHCGEVKYHEEDSTWGFIGDYEKSGMLDYLPDEVKPLLLGKEAA